MSDASDKVKEIFQDSRLASKVVDLVITKRPANWGRRSVAPYFNEKHGKQMKEVLLEMMKTKEDQIFNYEYFKEKFNMGRVSLYLRVNQSMRYVIEYLDDERQTFGRFCSMISINKIDAGVILRFKENCRDGDVNDFKPKSVIAKDAPPIWKEKLQDYLENAKPGDKPLLIEKLALTTNEIKELKISLSSVKGVLFNINSYSIKVVLVPVESIK